MRRHYELSIPTDEGGGLLEVAFTRNRRLAPNRRCYALGAFAFFAIFFFFLLVPWMCYAVGLFISRHFLGLMLVFFSP
jgi:hypothetical protein